MRDLKDICFDWDQWNAQKNEVKHGVSRMESESVFFDPNYKLFRDEKHSSSLEERFILYGESLERRILMIGFTVRQKRIRMITARQASRREREVYGKAK